MHQKKSYCIVGIIPARFGSTRFPGKPLVKILDKTLIQHTYENALKCSDLEKIIIATDDARIYDHVRSFGGDVIMTPETCETGTDRLAYVVAHHPNLRSAEIIVNIQGDEPCLDPQAIASIIKVLQSDEQAHMSTAIMPIQHEEEAHNPNDVKCVIDLNGNALYFSRSFLPGNKTLKFQKNMAYYKHIGIYAYRPDFLLHYATLPSTPLQLAEDLEQLKVLEHGYKIKTAIINSVNVGVNTPEDIKKVEQEICKQNLSLSLEGFVPLSEKD